MQVCLRHNKCQVSLVFQELGKILRLVHCIMEIILLQEVLVLCRLSILVDRRQHGILPCSRADSNMYQFLALIPVKILLHPRFLHTPVQQGLLVPHH
jgi:hypothetical protein